MFGIISYRSKVLRVLDQEFNYKPAVPGQQAQVFNAITKQIKERNGNEYDGAIAFMMIQIDSLMSNSNPEVIEWKNRTTSIINEIMHYGVIGRSI